MTVTVSRDKVVFGYFNMLEKRISKNTHFDWKRSYKSIHVTVIAVGSVDVNTLHIGGNGWVSNNANDGKEDRWGREFSHNEAYDDDGGGDDQSTDGSDFSETKQQLVDQVT